MRVIILFFIMSTALWGCHLHPTSNTTTSSFSDLTREQMIQETAVELNHRYQQGIYKPDPAPELASVILNPDAFFLSWRERFLAEKAKGADPYGFDVFDYAQPILQDMKQKLEWKLTDPSYEPQYTLTDANPERKMAYMDLVYELANMLDARRIGYREFIRIGYFYSRLIGHHDHAKLTANSKFMKNFHKIALYVDRKMQGYKQLSWKDEYALYKKVKLDPMTLNVFENSSPVPGFIAAEPIFMRDIFAQDDLKMIILPTTRGLERKIFMHLLSSQIFLTGITDIPIGADGFERPGGDFWVHDMRHSTVIYQELREYLDSVHISDYLKARAFRILMTSFWIQSEEHIATWANEDERRAAIFFMFNHHHDRGFYLMPSVYGPGKMSDIPEYLRKIMMFTDQLGDLSFRGGRATLERAYAKLRKWWLNRLPTETIFLQCVRMNTQDPSRCTPESKR